MKLHRTLHLPPHTNIVILLFGGILFFYALEATADLLIPLAFAFVLSLFLYPLCQRIERYVGRGGAIALSLLLVGLSISLVLGLIYGNLLSFAADLPQMEQRINTLINLAQTVIEEKFQISSESQVSWLQENFKSFAASGGKLLNSTINSITSFLTQLFLIPIYAFFMLLYRHVFQGFLNKALDAAHQDRAMTIRQQVQNVIQKYIAGLFTVVSIVAVLNVVGLWAIGIKHALFFGVLAAFLTIIPYIGIFIGSLLPIVYALTMTDSLMYPLAVFIWFQVVQALEGNVITPNVVGSQVSINPLVAMLALLIGGNVWGIAGMILFVPFTAMLKVALDNIPMLAPYGFLLGEGEAPQTEPTQPSFWQKIIFWKNKNT